MHIFVLTTRVQRTIRSSIICQQLLTTSRDLSRPKSRLLSNGAPIYCNLSAVQLLSLLLCCCTLRLSRCQTSVDYFIMLLAKEESDRSFLESGRVIRRMTPYQSQFVSQANQREQFSHFASFFLVMCLILERFGGV